jgi:hypothetical protein
MHRAVTAVLDEHLGDTWRAAADHASEPLDEVTACSVALGLSA